MRNRIITLSFREIKKSFKRFLSLLIISFLGVAVFVGMRSSSNTMISSLDKYYDNNNVYDLKIVSTLGLTIRDVEELEKLSLISEAYGVHSKDVYLEFNEKDYVLKIVGINEFINKPIVVDGRMPNNIGEIIVEENVLNILKLKIGDTININKDDTLNGSKFIIVGTCINPSYLLAGSPAMMRGTTNIGSGQVNFYSYTQDELFNMDYFTEIYLKVLTADDYLTNSDDYNKLIDKAKEEVDEIKLVQETERYNTIYKQVMEEITKNEKTLSDVRNGLNNAGRELNRGYNELKKNELKISNAKKELGESLVKLENAKKEITDGEEKLNDAKKKIDSAKKEINNELAEYNLTYEDILTIRKLLIGEEVTKENFKSLVDDNKPYASSLYSLIDYLYDNDYYSRIYNFFKEGTENYKQKLIEVIPTSIEYYDEIIDYLNNIDTVSIREYMLTSILTDRPLVELKKYIPTSIKNYDKIISYLDNTANTVNSVKKLFEAINMISHGETEVLDNEEKLKSAKNEYEKGYLAYLDYKKQIDNGEAELLKGYRTYYNNLSIYNQNKNEFYFNSVDYEKKIEEAKRDINSLEIPTWYITSRNDNSDYASFINVCLSVNKLSLSFPVVFFVVAIFMSIMSMSRMALEDRGEIGSLKSLGFSNFHIMMKYVIYSSLATLIGGLLGSVFGFFYLSYFVWKMYRILFIVTEFRYFFSITPFVISILLSFISITGVSILTVRSIIKEKTAVLLRPKAPKNGKQIFLEKLRVWKHISFSNKVTIRNIFRYKKRVIMTIVGISGCTMLLIAGYGIKDSIVNITNKQYSEVQIFDDIVYLDGNEDDADEIMNSDKIKSKLNLKLLSGYVLRDSVNLNAFNPLENSDNMLNLVSIKTNKQITFEKGKVVVSSKLAKMHKLDVGDKFIFIDNDKKEYEMIVSDIAKNYIGHHVYMDNETYEDIIGDYNINMVYLKFDDVLMEEETISEIIEKDHVLAVSSVSYTKQTVNNMVSSIYKVVLILIIFSGLLSIVVLYNLSYINISERKREIASLKVLGFYYYEVDNYIIKENIIITLIGIMVGLLIGKPFVDFIIDSIEIDLISFIHEISFNSYLFTSIFMIGFTTLVCFIIHFVLKKINMIDSLKSVE